MPMRIPALAAAVLTLACAPAVHAEDGAQAASRDSRLEQAFGSTIVSTYPDGRQAELWLKRDGTYTAEGRRHDRSSGVWQLKTDKDGTKLCLKQRKPFLPFASYCTKTPEGGLDRAWAGRAPTGEATTIRLVKGIYDPAARDESKDAARAASSDKTQVPRSGDDG